MPIFGNSFGIFFFLSNTKKILKNPINFRMSTNGDRFVKIVEHDGIYYFIIFKYFQCFSFV
jgi:hypothetical protein